MRRFLLLTVLGLSVVAASWAQEEPASPPTPQPPAADQTKSKSRRLLTDEQRAQAEQHLDAQWSKMPVEAKTKLMRLHRALAEMPPDERKFIHERIERFLNMSPAERERLKQNKQKWEQMTPEERQKAREEFRKRRQEFEEKWRRDHPGGEPQANPLPDPKTSTPPPDTGASPSSPSTP